MKLKNKNGKEREFELLLEVYKDGNNYLIYKDFISNKLYSSRKNDNKLEVLNEEEFEYIDNLIKKIDG